MKDAQVPIVFLTEGDCVTSPDRMRRGVEANKLRFDSSGIPRHIDGSVWVIHTGDIVISKGRYYRVVTHVEVEPDRQALVLEELTVEGLVKKYMK